MRERNATPHRSADLVMTRQLETFILRTRTIPKLLFLSFLFQPRCLDVLAAADAVAETVAPFMVKRNHVTIELALLFVLVLFQLSSLEFDIRLWYI